MKYGEGNSKSPTRPGAKRPAGVGGSADRQGRSTGAVRTRFAPSPTGYLHVGGIRTALFAWLVARQAEGQFILRIEDTDRNRHVEAAEQHIIDSLKALKLEYDEGPDIGGQYGPYRQSERLDDYKKWGQKLVDNGRAYADPTTEEELDKLRGAAKTAKKPFLYRQHRPTSTPEWDGSQPLRFKSEPQDYKWQDAVLGELSAGKEAVDDFIIIKSDGFPTYNFAHIIDDKEMEISHVIRSTEFLASMPKFLNLYEALGIEPPIFATPPAVLGPEGNKKLSKRDGAKDVLDYIREGYLPEALNNFMASLGWNDGTEQEIFSMKELVDKFKLDRVQHRAARFDEQRLLWMNGYHIRELPDDELYDRAEDYWPPIAKASNQQYKRSVLELVKERLKFFAELPNLTSFFFEEPKADDVLKLYKEPVDKQLKKGQIDYAAMLEASIGKLQATEFKHEAIQLALNELLKELETKPAVLFPIIRIALTGSSMSPEIFGTLEVLGKDKSLGRLEKALALLEKAS